MKQRSMKITDMTKGNSLRLILGFAFPLLIGNVFQQIYSIVDTMTAGYVLGDSAIAAIGATTSVVSFLIELSSGMNSGFALVIARAFGQKDQTNVQRAVGGTMALNISCSALFTVMLLTFMNPILHFLNTPSEIYAEVYQYTMIVCAGFIATSGYNMFSAILRAVGNSITPLCFLIFSSVMNIILDILFIAGFGWGVVGAGIATVVSSTVAAVLSCIYFVHQYRALLPSRNELFPIGNMLRELFVSGLSMGMMLGVVNVGSIVFQGANNALGEVYIAAHTSARRIILLVMEPLGVLASASGTFISQNYGAQKYKRIREALKRVLLIAGLWGALACLFIYAGGAFLIQLTTGSENPEVIRCGVLSLRVHLPCYPVLGILLVLRTALQGMRRRVIPVVSSSIELAMKIIFAAVLIPRIGFLGTCVTEPATWVACMAFVVTAYLIERRKIYLDK